MVDENHDMLKHLQIDQKGVLIADIQIAEIGMILDMMIEDQTGEKAGEMTEETIGGIEIEVAVEGIVEGMKGVTEVDLPRGGDIGNNPSLKHPFHVPDPVKIRKDKS